jgi:hypothetical protein
MVSKNDKLNNNTDEITTTKKTIKIKIIKIT